MIIVASNTLYQNAGAKPSQITLFSSGTAMLNVLMTLVAAKLMDAAGRRTLLLLSGSGQAFSMGIAFVCSIIADNSAPPAAGAPPGTTAYIMIAAINLFIISFAVGFGPTVWVYLSEIYPKELRGSCLSAGICVNWMSSATVVFVLVNLFALAGKYQKTVQYGTLTLLNLLCLLFVYIYIVETKGSSIEDSPMYNRANSESVSKRSPRAKAAVRGSVDTAELLPISATEGTSSASAE